MKEGISMSNEELYTLIREYLLGNDSSFNKFYDDTKKKVFANIYSYVKNEVIAEDILSDVYIKFLELRHTLSSFHSMHQNIHCTEDLLDSFKPYMSSSDAESVDQMLSMMSMMNMMPKQRSIKQLFIVSPKRRLKRYQPC